MNKEQREEKAKELFKMGYNCAQSVLGVYCEELGLDFETAMKLSSSFGGGMGRLREVCGAVSGMFMVLGLLYSTGKNKKEQYEKVQEIAKKFKDKNGSIICRELLNGIETSTSPTPSVRDEAYYKKRPCLDLVVDAVEIIENYKKEKETSKV